MSYLLRGVHGTVVLFPGLYYLHTLLYTFGTPYCPGQAVRLVKALHEPYQALPSVSMDNGTIKFAGEYRSVPLIRPLRKYAPLFFTAKVPA